MALVRTTLSSACGIGDAAIVVASATGFASGYRLLIDQEVMEVAQGYTTGTTIPVLRAKGGTVIPTVSHQATAGVVVGTGADWTNPSPQTDVLSPIAGRARVIASYSAAGAIALPNPGSDMVAILNGTTARAMTIAAPDKANDGDILYIVSNGAAAHTLTFAGGLSGGSTSYDVITINSSAPAAFQFIAANSLWMTICAAPMGGTVTNLIGSIA